MVNKINIYIFTQIIKYFSLVFFIFISISWILQLTRLFTISNFMQINVLNIIYLSKSKSDVINIENNSVDFYYSRSVLEHITKNSLIDIIYEGKRILKNNGLFISKIDLSDHFAKKNNKLSQINFLRFSNFLWEILCKNSSNFTNRLRISDYKREFQSSGMFLVSEDSKVNMECLSDLEKGRFKVHKDFFDYNFEDLATTSSFIIYKKK